MRDAIGGTFTIQIILFFLLIINSYLAFSVNYTKAFRIKNNIVAILEQQEGWTVNGPSNAYDRVEQIMLNTGYNVDAAVLAGCKEEGYVAITNDAGGFCLKSNIVYDENGMYDFGGYYSVKTYVNIDLPIINNILPISNLFAIKGETKTIYSEKVVPIDENL